jgi:eukaryotic-like serine/threonine-protein kinase
MNNADIIPHGEARLPNPGEVIDERYRIEEVIGRGGMGTIVRAHQLSLGRDVAIKLLHADTSDDDALVKRFLREVDLAKSLTHPHIIRYFDFGRTSRGKLYLAMELLDGHELRQEIDLAGPFEVGRATEITLQVLDGLSAAHARSVLHRDIKPRNLFLQPSRRGDFVKILDFGIAKSLRGSGTRLTQTGAAPGTPSYMAPEMLTSSDLTPAADLYAVGLVYLEMLIGRAVFEADTMAGLFFKQLCHSPPIPRELANTDLATFFERALAKETEHRFASADEMLRALHEMSADVPGQLRVSDESIHALRAAEQSPRPQNMADLAAWVHAGPSTDSSGALSEADGTAPRTPKALREAKDLLTTLVDARATAAQTPGALKDTSATAAQTPGALKDTSATAAQTPGALKDTSATAAQTPGARGDTAAIAVPAPIDPADAQTRSAPDDSSGILQWGGALLAVCGVVLAVLAAVGGGPGGEHRPAGDQRQAASSAGEAAAPVDPEELVASTHEADASDDVSAAPSGEDAGVDEADAAAPEPASHHREPVAKEGSDGAADVEQQRAKQKPQPTAPEADARQTPEPANDPFKKVLEDNTVRLNRDKPDADK